MVFSPAVSIVTGGASGIGRALVERLVARGGHVVVADRDLSALTGVRDQWGDAVTIEPLDVTEPGAVAELVQRTVASRGRLDLMANNAGVLFYGPAAEVTSSHWDRALAVNLRAVVDGAHAAYEVMRETGGGTILNTGSTAGLMISPRQLPYTTTKQAVVAYSRALAIEARADGVGVHVVCPGFVDTKLLDEPAEPSQHAGSFRGYAGRLQPRLLSPGEVADAALRGIERGRVVIPVGLLAHALWRLDRAVPALVDAGSALAARREDRRAGAR
ncbi:SDR family NAD(P)-dependent oxidoreductase [Kytococcus sedentarius]|uniref:SDR family NAD(P)-dependent oxidoreductase n=1 Tax=Kytococcus sedentarius TaxID=1276 RepID=UPI0035BC8656